MMEQVQNLELGTVFKRRGAHFIKTGKKEYLSARYDEEEGAWTGAPSTPEVLAPDEMVEVVD